MQDLAYINIHLEYQTLLRPEKMVYLGKNEQNVGLTVEFGNMQNDTGNIHPTDTCKYTSHNTTYTLFVPHMY